MIDKEKTIACVNMNEKHILTLFRGAAEVHLDGFSNICIHPKGCLGIKKRDWKVNENIQEYDPNLKSQIRKGKLCIKLMLKIQDKNDFNSGVRYQLITLMHLK